MIAKPREGRSRFKETSEMITPNAAKPVQKEQQVENMAKKKSTKKNHVSKHILKSRGDTVTATKGEDNISSSSSKKRDRKAKSHTKHPGEAASYLTQWEASKSEDPSTRASSSWKFNKNTQSWLIRHMYEVEKVPKPTFLLLLEYLDGLEGKFIIDRMRIDASRRCRRYKEYCKSNTQTSTLENTGEINKKTENQQYLNEKNDDLEKKKKETGITRTAMADQKAELENEEAQWNKMDDHEKRKQYKRARKILDLLKKSG